MVIYVSVINVLKKKVNVINVFDKVRIIYGYNYFFMWVCFVIFGY